MYQQISEGQARCLIPTEQKVSRELPVFFNPLMELNRSITILLLNTLRPQSIQVCDLLAGTGMRTLRLLLELDSGIIHSILANDANPKGAELIRKNLALNNLTNASVTVTNTEANKLLVNSSGFDYIDIDPFGSPNPFLSNSIMRLSRRGILAVTATDTSALSGTFPAACIRKYFAVPMLNEQKHEIGLRILIRKIQLIGAHHGRALMPLLSYSKDHYMRVFFRSTKGLRAADKIMAQHAYFLRCPSCLRIRTSPHNNETCACGYAYQFAGPIYIGPLYDASLQASLSHADVHNDFIHLLVNEAHSVGLYDLHRLAKAYRLVIPSITTVIERLRSSSITATRTHFLPTALKADCDVSDVVQAMKP